MTFKRTMAAVVSVAMLAGMTMTAAADDQVTLRFSWWGGDERHEKTLAVIEAFEAANPNIKIEPEYSSFDGYMEKKTTEFASQTAPDIFQIETGSGPEYYKNGVLYNISDTEFDVSNFDPYFLEMNGQFGSGSQYALPTGMAGSALIVNKTLADEIGIDLTQPYDWEYFFELGKKVREYDPECYLLSANTQYGTAFFIRAWMRQVNGLPIMSDDYTLNVTEEQFAECFDFIRRLYEEEVCAPASYKAPYGDQDQEDPNWIAGKYVADVGYTSSTNVLKAANPDVEYMAGQMPLREDRKSDGWFNDCPQLIGIYANTQHPAEAAQFLNFFYNTEEAAAILGTCRSVPPTAMAQEVCEREGVMDALSREAVDVSLQYDGQSDAGLTTCAEVTSILEDAYENVSYGAMSPEDAAAEVVTLLNDFIDMNK